jgi:hypothetical protein
MMPLTEKTEARIRLHFFQENPVLTTAQFEELKREVSAKLALGDASVSTGILAVLIKQNNRRYVEAKEQNVAYILLEDCEVGCVYRVEARNFKLAVFDGKSFIGIREKFGNRFLDSENHWDAPDHATCKPIEKTEHRAPEEIGLSVRSGQYENSFVFDFLDQLECG